ncbi:MAG: cupin domain-containing protein [Ruminiclostridium sp.]|nr:cupin domain-containing protein [Ruminiclostridium sp.]
MNDINIIKKDALDEALSKKYRLYLTGRLQKPQNELQFIEDDIEVGISRYDVFTADTPHMHPVATEHAYVLEGSIRVRLLDGSEKEFEVNAGDFFVLRPGIPYATKNKEGTKVLFIKSPEGNDKTVVEADEKTKEWLGSWNVQL